MKINTNIIIIYIKYIDQNQNAFGELINYGLFYYSLNGAFAKIELTLTIPITMCSSPGRSE